MILPNYPNVVNSLLVDSTEKPPKTPRESHNEKTQIDSDGLFTPQGS